MTAFIKALVSLKGADCCAQCQREGGGGSVWKWKVTSRWEDNLDSVAFGCSEQLLKTVCLGSQVQSGDGLTRRAL